MAILSGKDCVDVGGGRLCVEDVVDHDQRWCWWEC